MTHHSGLLLRFSSRSGTVQASRLTVESCQSVPFARTAGCCALRALKLSVRICLKLNEYYDSLHAYCYLSTAGMQPTVVIEDVTDWEAIQPSPVFATPPGSTNSDHEYESLASESDEEAHSAQHHSSKPSNAPKGSQQAPQEVRCRSGVTCWLPPFPGLS